MTFIAVTLKAFNDLISEAAERDIVIMEPETIKVDRLDGRVAPTLYKVGRAHLPRPKRRGCRRSPRAGYKKQPLGGRPELAGGDLAGPAALRQRSPGPRGSRGSPISDRSPHPLGGFDPQPPSNAVRLGR
jgi:hypothetical protein